MRRTDVRPSDRRRAISAWLTFCAKSLRTFGSRSAADFGRPSWRPSRRACSRPALTRERRISRSNSEDREHARHRATRRSGEVERLGQRDEADVERGEVVESDDEISERASPTVEAPHQDGVAIDLLRRMNAEGTRKLPEDAPTAFVPGRWRAYVRGADGQFDRCYYELCALWQMRDALRAGDVWLEQSRRYADPESYLIPMERWEPLRPAVCEQIGAPADGSARIDQRGGELGTLLERFDKRMPGGEDVDVGIADGRLVVRRLTAEDVPASVTRLGQLVDERLPLVELPDLMLEVDGWTRFSDALEHAGHGEPRSKDVLINCHAGILAQACNFGLTRMARIASLSYSQLAWCSTWYLREETLSAANIKLVNAQFRQPLAHHWGGGTVSSSNGQRFPVPVQARNATAIPRYFGFGRGLTFYSWTSDQFSQYGCKPVPTTTRDATYVLDAILGNETELPIAEHTTDTAGYTDLVFALFDLLGLQFSPRLRDLADQRLFRVDRGTQYEHLEPLLRGTIRKDLIVKHWDDLLRVAGSMKRGYVTASLFIGKLQSYQRQNTITRALQEYGRLIKRTKSTKAKELTIRVSAEERRAIEGAAGADHLPASTWARQVVLRRVDEAHRERERREERQRVGRELAAMLKSLPDDSVHADEMERSRREDWKR